VLERFDETGRRAVVGAQAEARLLGHDEIGEDHLLLGVAGAAPELVGVPVEALRARVSAARGGRGRTPDGPASFAPEARSALERAGQEAIDAGRATIGVADLLAALVAGDGRAADVLARVGVDSIAGARSAGSDALDDELDVPVPAGPSPAAVARLADAGEAVPAALAGSPIGDVGDPRTDARLLLAILAFDGPVGELLRANGLDETAIRDALPDVD
jgi:ATP-dependent Clp protease ATP-binding subunit ClpC